MVNTIVFNHYCKVYYTAYYSIYNILLMNATAYCTINYSEQKL